MSHSKPVFFTAEIREIEQIAATSPNPPELMEKAGLAAAQVAQDRLLTDKKRCVLIIAGPGNNGGDAFVVARYLKQWGNHVSVVFTGDRTKLSQDSSRAMEAWLAVGGKTDTELPNNKKWHIIIDGLFGIGLQQDRNLEGKYLDLVNTVNGMNLPVLALDIPSGLGSDNGVIHGIAVHAAITVTFIGLKPGMLTNYGPDYCGEILVRDLGLDITAMLLPRMWQLDQNLIPELLPPPRPANSHKGTYGSIGIIGGSSGMIGATLLAGRAALKLGAGRVYLGIIAENAPAVDMLQPELMLRSPHDLFKQRHLSCLIAGPGLGTELEAHTWLENALVTELPLVLDADALNLIATHASLEKILLQRKLPTILTPHPAEASRLLKTEIATVQNDRLNAALKLARRFNCYAVLKGAGSICVTPEGKRYLNTSGNPGLSSAGTGDVLSGMIGALITQALNLEHALLLAVYLHGAAADNILKQNNGPIGMTASEIINATRNVLNSWVYKA